MLIRSHDKVGFGLHPQNVELTGVCFPSRQRALFPLVLGAL
jgi:hypothetical protein